MFDYFKSFLFGQCGSAPQQLNKDNPRMNISSHLLQRYLSFMSEEISYFHECVKNTNDYITKSKHRPEFKEIAEGIYEDREKLQQDINKLSSIQTEVKRALLNSCPVRVSVAQAMEKQVTIHLKTEAIWKFVVKNSKDAFEDKQHYLDCLNKVKNKEARLVQLQQAIRKAKMG